MERIKAIAIDWVFRVAGGVLLAWGIYALWLAPLPVQLHYQHPYFISAVVQSRQDAESHEVVHVRHGETVHRYIEYTLHSNRSGTVSDRWTCENGFQMHGDDRQNFRLIGTRKASIPTHIPHEVPLGVKCEYWVSIEYPREVFGSQYYSAPPVTFVVQ